MNLLLDTHVFLWWDQAHAALRSDVSDMISDPAHQIFVSAASVWEIAIKSRLGKLEFSGSPKEAIARNNFSALSMTVDDVEAAGALDWSHADPFDRMLVAQTRGHGFTLVHADKVIRAFNGVAQLWARI